MLGKIAGLLLLRNTMSDSSSLIQSLLAGMAAVAILTLIATLLFAALLLGGIYVGHQILLANGVAPLTTAWILGGAVLCLFIVCTIMVFTCVRRIRNIPRRAISANTPLGNQIRQLADAFIAGLNTPPAH